ncbi:MAG TPA: methylated-DNA--[protein]-cysteine S-methyltransferase [Thermomicrobiaceae bacterium]|nr:methylated-DNA--[protein]-cysteine S-methyltransferase [Thermomicrobiaceae bacterium]
MERARLATPLTVGVVDTPLGPVWLAAGASGLRAITVPGSTRQSCLHLARGEMCEDAPEAAQRWLDEAAVQLGDYFAGRLRRFTLPLDLVGTPFQRRVWQAVAAVPFGETATYREIAARIGAPRAYRAVGAANGANPAAIVIPCHRLVGADGGLRGYGGGLHQKRALLDLEAAVMRAKPGG